MEKPANFNENEKPPIYNEKGEVVDLEIARQGAEIERKSRKKILGIFAPSRKNMRVEEVNAEFVMEEAEDIDFKDLPFSVKKELVKYKGEASSIDIEDTAKSDIGGGVMRYRILYSTSRPSTTVVLTPTNSIQPLSTRTYKHFLITVDLRDGNIIKSHQENW